jgi:hypothetical protein
VARSVSRLPDGGIRVVLTPDEHAALAALPAQLRPLIDGQAEGDLAEAVRGRLFPAAYDDPELEEEYRSLAGDDLVEGRLDQLDVFAASLAATRPARGRVRIDLDPAAAAAWLAVVNDTRLILGSLLGITSEDEWEGGPDPDDDASVLLWYLGWLEEGLVAAMMGGL